MTPAYIRPSALPKLEAQPCFVGASGEASEAAQRGTFLDAAWRHILGARGNVFWANDTPNEDREAVEWAVAEAKKICGGEHIETDEEKTRFVHPLFANPFTADGICESRGIVIDLKTGQLRSYKAQLAAYCLALMDRTFSDAATGVALFCDQREAIHYAFSYAEAQEYVTSIIDAVVARKADDYTPGDYCGWCMFADTCPARTEPTEQAIELVSRTEEKSIAAMREAILATPESLGRFWTQWRLFEKEIAKPIGDAMRERLDGGAEIPGWRIQYDKPREFFDSEAIEEIAKSITTDELITLLGAKVSGKAFREFCAVKGLAVNEAAARSGAPIAKIMPEKKKSTTKKGK